LGRRRYIICSSNNRGKILNRHQNQGKIFVRPTSYGHLSDDHDVNISGVAGGQFLQYDSVTDFWIPSNSGNFSSLQVNGTGVSINGHTHTSSNITDFTESVQDVVGASGFLIAGTGIVLDYNDSANTLTISSSGTGGGGGVSITNYADNRILTSDGTSTGINAETNLTFDGTSLKVNNIDVSVSGHLHTSSNISDFIDAVNNIIIHPFLLGGM
jgi:hypothetical protein